MEYTRLTRVSTLQELKFWFRDWSIWEKDCSVLDLELWRQYVDNLFICWCSYCVCYGFSVWCVINGVPYAFWPWRLWNVHGFRVWPWWEVLLWVCCVVVDCCCWLMLIFCELPTLVLYCLLRLCDGTVRFWLCGYILINIRYLMRCWLAVYVSSVEVVFDMYCYMIDVELDVSSFGEHDIVCCIPVASQQVYHCGWFWAVCSHQVLDII